MSIRIYRVGGCVRDKLLRNMGWNLPEGDTDWVVVGATPETMIKRGFIPVGSDFPVFLHPQTHDEYALARTERKIGRGYHGFCFHADTNVTLEEDLIRRDLTINAMAETESGQLIDPYGGLDDLKAGVLRHVSNAFSEDPVRILRLARFAARFWTFTVADETMQLLADMVNNGEADSLIPERIWAEISRGIMEQHPSRMFEILAQCGYWQRAFSDMPLGRQHLEQLDTAALQKAPLAVRCAIVFSSLQDEKALREILKNLRCTTPVIELATLTVRLRHIAVTANTLEAYCMVLESSDVLRRPERFEALLQTITYLEPDFDATCFQKLALAFTSVDAGAIAKRQTDKRTIPSAIRAARRAAVATITLKR